MDNLNLMRVVKDHFEIEPEVFEVVMYCIAVLNINDAIQIATMGKKTEVRGIPPESYALMKRFDNGLTLNNFWLEHFAPIKMTLTLADIKANTLGHYVGFGEKNQDKNAFKQVRAIMLAKLDVLTLIAFLWKGITYAEEFDAKLRMSVQLTPEHEDYFKSKGI